VSVLHRKKPVWDSAIRRADELLKQIEPGHGLNQNIADGAVSKVLTRTDAARDAGMSKHQQVQAAARSSRSAV